MTEPRRRDARHNAARISQVALQVLATDPRASMEQVAAAAGVSRVTLYSHVGSRGSLLRQVLQQHVADAVEALEQCSSEGEATAVLDDVTRCSWQSVRAVETLRAEAQAELGEAVVREAHEPVVRRIADLVERGRASGALTTPGEPGWLARCYLALVQQASRESGEEARVLADLLTAVRSLLGARPVALSAAAR